MDAPDDEETANLRDRLRLVKGVLYFRLNESFKARMWRERRSVKDLDLALKEAQARLILGREPGEDAPVQLHVLCPPQEEAASDGEGEETPTRVERVRRSRPKLARTEVAG